MGVSSTGATQSNSTQVDAGNDTADYPNGGGVDKTLKTTNTGKTGIPSVEQVDPSTALAYFQTAANNYQTNALQGLQYYQQAMQNAISTVQQGFQTANAQLTPLSSSGATANAQFMQMLGINSYSPSSNMYQQAEALGSQYTDVAGQMRSAESIADPGARQQALTQITTSLQALNQQQTASIQQQQQAAIAALGPRPTGESVLGQMMSNGDPLANQLAFFGDPNGINKGNLSQLGNLPSVQAVGTAQKAYDDQVAAINAQYGQQLSTFQQSAGALVQGYQGAYDPNDNHLGFNQSQINNTLSSNVAGFSQAMNRLNTTDTGKVDINYLSQNVPGFSSALNRINGQDQTPINTDWLNQNAAGFSVANNRLNNGDIAPITNQTLANQVPGFSTMLNNFQGRDQAPIDLNYLNNNVAGFGTAYGRLTGQDVTPLNNQTLQNTPGYQFMYDQGNQSVLAAAAAGGMLGSGNTLTAADKYSQGLAQQVYQYQSGLQQQQYATDLASVQGTQQQQQALQQGYYNTDSAGLQNALTGQQTLQQNQYATDLQGVMGSQQYNQTLQQQQYTTDNQIVSQEQQFLQNLQNSQYNADQGLLQSGQQNYMANLMGEAGMGANATGAMATNSANSGIQAGNLYSAGGTAALNTYTGIGQALYNSATNQGNTQNQDSLSNMAAQNAMIMAQTAKGSNLAGIAGLANTAAQMGNQQEQANGFSSAMNGGGGTSGGYQTLSNGSTESAPQFAVGNSGSGGFTF